MAQSTVLNEFFNIISFKTDQASLAQAQSAITSFKGSPVPFFNSSQSSDKNSSKSSKNTTKRKSKKGLEITYLMNGHIHIDDYIRLESKSYSGNYRMSKIAFSGDTDGGDWICKAQIVEVKK